jgi:hypothetical protein
VTTVPASLRLIVCAGAGSRMLSVGGTASGRLTVTDLVSDAWPAVAVAAITTTPGALAGPV